MPCGVALALTDRAVTREHFEGDARFDPVVRALMARTEVRPLMACTEVRPMMARTEVRRHPDMPDDSPLQWSAEIVVTTSDGQRFVARLDDFEWLGPGARPMTSAAMWETFADRAQRALPPPRIAPRFEHLAGIARVETMADLSRLTEVGRAPEAAWAA
jgi:2-methylcitrate dehydratase PrpD